MYFDLTSVFLFFEKCALQIFARCLMNDNAEDDRQKIIYNRHVVGSVVEKLDHVVRDPHGLRSQPTRAILLWQGGQLAPEFSRFQQISNYSDKIIIFWPAV